MSQMQPVVRCCTMGKLLLNPLLTEFDYRQTHVTLACVYNGLTLSLLFLSSPLFVYVFVLL